MAITAGEIINGLGGNPETGMCRCPAHDDKTPSLHVEDGNNGKVLVKCHAGCTQERVIDALRARGLWSKGHRASSAPKQSEPEGTEALARALLRAAAKTTDQPTEYLRGRGIENVPQNLKLIARSDALKIIRRRFPTMVAPIINEHGEEIGAHTTALTLNAKEKVAGTARKIYGHKTGGFIQLVEVIDPGKPLLIGEGIESTLSAMLIAGEQGISAIDAGNMKSITPPAATEYVVTGDNDAAGRDAAEALAQRLTSQGCKVRIALPEREDTDWNDALQAGGDLEAMRDAMLTAPLFVGSESSDEGFDDKRLDELATLSAFEYEKRRKAVAKELNIRPSALDREVAARRELRNVSTFMAPVEPWHEPVDGDELLNSICDVLERHLVLPKYACEAIGLWTLHTHAHDAARNSPILFISSPTKRCGKTNLLWMLSLLTPKPLPASNVTPATVFRAIDLWHPTLLIDESDTFISDKSELRGVLNSGHTKSAAHVVRCVGDDLTPKPFSTWSPKAFAAIGRIHPTLEDRSIKVELKRKLRNEVVERIPGGDDAYRGLTRQCARWAQDHFTELEKANPPVPQELSDRARDNWYPLLAIADSVGGEWPSLARKAATQLSALDDDESYGELLLRDLRDLFREGGNLWSEQAVASLVEMEDRPWAEFRHGKGLTVHGLAKLLKPFKIFPRKIRIDGSGPKRSGYTADRFDYVWRRYLDDEGGEVIGPTGLHENSQGLSGGSNRASTSDRDPIAEPAKPLRQQGKAR